MEKPQTTHFGNESVAWDEKAGRVKEVFDRVAFRYDLMNDLMSAGMHRLWKKALIDLIRPTPAMQLLDVAGGTGDIAQRFLQAGGGEVTLCDINEAMLREGRDRAIDSARLSGLRWVCGNAECLPLPDRAFDVYTIAFGIRNVTDIPAALREALRVLKPGGRFFCLEFSHVPFSPLRDLYELYSTHLIPPMGKAVTGDDAPYRYLVESIRRFPAQEPFARMIRDAGFANVRYRNLSAGVVAIHSGLRA